MAQITVYENYSDLLAKDDADLHLDKIGDYVSTYRAIAGALQTGEKLAVSVNRGARVCTAWFREMAQQRGQDRFRYVEVTPRSHLASRWDVEIPVWATDKAIHDAGLLTESVSPISGETFEDIIARRFFSPHLAHDRLPLSHLVELVSDLNDQQRDSIYGSQLFRNVYRRGMNRWMDAARNEGERLLIRLLRDNPEELHSLLSQYKVLSGYPVEVGLRAMGDEFEHLRSLTIDLGGMLPGKDEIQTAVEQIRVHLNQMCQRDTSIGLVEELLGQVSGVLEVEFEVLYDLLTERDIPIDRYLLARMSDRFSPIESRVTDRMQALKLLIAPERPEKPNPDGDWNVNKWLQWAVDRYLPYRFWLEETEQRDEEIEGMAEAYGDWLDKSFPYLRPNFHNMVFRALHNQIGYLEGEKPVLFVAIDNFNHKFLGHLEKLMEKAGFYCAHTAAYLSMLPTCTEVSKKCLFTGSPEPFLQTAYERPIRDAWTTHLGGRRLHYLAYLGMLNDISKREHDVYFLNHTHIDRALHQSEMELGTSHAKAVQRRIEDLVDAVTSFSRRIQSERDLVVIACSDHGSTRIPAETPNFIDEQFYVERVDDPHHRYVSISGKEMDALPDNVDFECYRLRRKALDLNKNYLVARGYYRFKETDKAAYVHGGMTPEETIVPLSVFLPVVEKPKPLSVRLLRKEFRYGTRATINLELTNVNPYTCLHLDVDVLDDNIASGPVKVDLLAARDTAEVSIPARIQRREGEMSVLHVQIAYHCLGERRRQVEELPITMRSIMETGFDLEELDGVL